MEYRDRRVILRFYYLTAILLSSRLFQKVENELNLHDSTSESTTKDVDETTNDEEYSQIKVENEKIIQENIHGDSLR